MYAKLCFNESHQNSDFIVCEISILLNIPFQKQFAVDFHQDSNLLVWLIDLVTLSNTNDLWNTNFMRIVIRLHDRD